MPEKTYTFTAVKDVPETSWSKLSRKRIFFGHRSVGNNIIAGIRDLIKENPQIKLRIVETSKPSDFNTPLFAHALVGKNTDPKSKIDAFATFVEKGIGDKADIAFFKFCFVDIMDKTDIQKVFGDYRNTMSHLKKKYPKTIFIHMTVPLSLTKTTIKTWIKKIMGKTEIWEYDQNVRKNQFNDLLRSEYDGKEPIFDLARTESTFPDGRRSTFTKGANSYYSLVPDYTHDGGHLNETGRKIVAAQLLILLASLSVE